MVERKTPRRISSLFSLVSNSSEKDTEVTKSSSSLSLAGLSKDSANAQNLRPSTSDIRIETPPPNENGFDHGLSPAQTPQYDPGRLAPSPEPEPIVSSPENIVASPDLIATSPQEDLSLPSPQILLPDTVHSQTDSVLGSREEGRPRSRTECRVNCKTNSLIEHKRASRSGSPSKFLNPSTQIESMLSKRKSWLPGKLRTTSQGGALESPLPQAWVLTPHDMIPYSILDLVNFHKVGELWEEDGDCIVYLHSGNSEKGPSFKINSACFASSIKLSSVAHGRSPISQRRSYERSQKSHDRKISYGRSVAGVDRSTSRSTDLSSDRNTPQISVTPTGSPPRSPPLGSSANGSSEGDRRTISDIQEEGFREIHLHVPVPLQIDLTDPHSTVTPDDIETLIAIRNLFAFLVRQPLVATPRHPSIFTIFLRIAEFLHRYEFTNLDGSTLGEESVINFQPYFEDFRLADVRNSREKIIEAIILGERMRSLKLYSEGFVHGVGRYDEILQLQSPKIHLISEITHQRMERATLDLATRLKTVRTRLEGFEFPSLFSGIAQSTSSTESKMVRFKAWRSGYMSMRKHVISFYTHRYGAWPPKARSKKNAFEESGLNRVLLLELYQDFSNLYDILVNRDALTTRTAELDSVESPMEIDPQASAPALRRVLGEFDHSLPPVQPPIPFDTPQLPSLATTRREYGSLDRKAQIKERSKSLQYDEMNMALMQSYNRDCIKSTSFLEAFMSFERKMAHGKSIDEMMDLRNGQWIFMYAVLQSLPLVVIDAPDVRWTEGVEYFLCEVPKGAAPWCQEDGTRKMGWYGIAGGPGVVSLPAELVEHGVEGIYRRSHCWVTAEKWMNNNAAPAEPDDYINHHSNHQNDPPILGLPDSLSDFPIKRRLRGSVHLGLEALPFPEGVRPSGSKPTATHDPSKNFEDILTQLNHSQVASKAQTTNKAQAGNKKK